MTKGYVIGAFLILLLVSLSITPAIAQPISNVSIDTIESNNAPLGCVADFTLTTDPAPTPPFPPPPAK